MELIARIARKFKRTSRRVPPAVPRDVELCARYAVQKIAREQAAAHALNVAMSVYRPNQRIASLQDISNLVKRHRTALSLRDFAVEELRLALGLSVHPTSIEVAEWGDAP